MKRARTLVARAIVGALLLVALTSSIASADPGRLPPVLPGLPEDPGIGFLPCLVLPEDPGIE
jgi:hypothetical protein